MRKLLLICAVVLLAGVAFGQVTILSGYATNQGWGGYYPAPPFVPLVSTPIVTLDTVSPSPAGASNATTGNVAGASNATLSIVQPPLTPIYTVPVWSGYDVIATATAPIAAPTPEAAPQPTPQAGAVPRHVEVGIASSEVEVAPLAKVPRQHEHAVRVYTNADIDRINQQNGTVKYDGKTLKIG
jgi:hypothetical protein